MSSPDALEPDPEPAPVVAAAGATPGPRPVPVEALRRIGFLIELTDDELARVAEACRERTYRAGEVVLTEGDPGPGLFMLVAGSAEVIKMGDHAHVIARLRPGDHFGEMSLLTEAPVSATIRASADRTRCWFIDGATFRDLLRSQPAIGHKVLWQFATTMSRRLVQVENDYTRALRKRSRWATVRHLLALLWLVLRMTSSYALVWLRKTVRLPHKPETLSRIHRTNARRFKATAFRLKGANVKLGQLASLQVHLFPPEYIDELRDMRGQVSPTPYPMVVGRIQEEFGLSPLEIFAELDKVPIAAASMGQVHAARLPSGERVAVKLLHPGLERAVDVDLWIVRKLLGFFSRFSGKVDLREVYRQSEEPLRKELDLLHEAAATEEIGKQLAPLGVKVPAVHWRYSTPRVLVTELIDGVSIDKLAQLDAWKVDRVKLMQDYLRAFLQQAFEGGYFHCDPHPGNVFCTQQGTLVLLDFGMVKRLDDKVREGLLKEALGGFFGDPKLYADGVVSRGIIAESERAKLEETARSFFDDPALQAALLQHDAKKDGDMKHLFGRLGEAINRFETFRTPRDELMFLRALGIVLTVVAEVVPETPMQTLAMPVLMPVLMRFMQGHPEVRVAPRAPA